MKKTLIVCATAIFMACSSSKNVATPTVEALAQSYTEASAEQLGNGKMLFEKGCDMCHALKKSYSVSNERLTEIVPKMVGKANKKAGQTLINNEGSADLLHYLLALNYTNRLEQ